MTAPLVELSQAYPHAELHVLTLEDWSSILTGFPGIYKTWTYRRHPNRMGRTRGLARLAYQLRKEKFELVVNFHASPSSAALSFATGARIRANHFHGHRAKDRYSTVEIPGKGILKPVIERDMDTLRALGLHIPAGRLPRVFIQKNEFQDASVFLKTLGLKKPLLVLGLGASRPTKIWPIERFADLALQWAEKKGGGVLAITSPAESDLNHRFLKKVGSHTQIQASSDLSLRMLGGILQSAAVFAGNDSGPRHLAVAVGTPTVTLFGPEHPFEWHPYPVESHPYSFVENLACRKDADPGMPPWCGLNTCIQEEHRCMKLLGVQNVMTLCQKVCR